MRVLRAGDRMSGESLPATADQLSALDDVRRRLIDAGELDAIRAAYARAIAPLGGDSSLSRGMADDLIAYLRLAAINQLSGRCALCHEWATGGRDCPDHGEEAQKGYSAA